MALFLPELIRNSINRYQSTRATVHVYQPSLQKGRLIHLGSGKITQTDLYYGYMQLKDGENEVLLSINEKTLYKTGEPFPTDGSVET